MSVAPANVIRKMKAKHKNKKTANTQPEKRAFFAKLGFNVNFDLPFEFIELSCRLISNSNSVGGEVDVVVVFVSNQKVAYGYKVNNPAGSLIHIEFLYIFSFNLPKRSRHGQ